MASDSLSAGLSQLSQLRPGSAQRQAALKQLTSQLDNGEHDRKPAVGAVDCFQASSGEQVWADGGKVGYKASKVVSEGWFRSETEYQSETYANHTAQLSEGKEVRWSIFGLTLGSSREEKSTFSSIF